MLFLCEYPSVPKGNGCIKQTQKITQNEYGNIHKAFISTNLVIKIFYVYVFSLPDSSYNYKHQTNLSFINYKQHSGNNIMSSAIKFRCKICENNITNCDQVIQCETPRPKLY